MKPEGEFADVSDRLIERLARGELGPGDAERVRAISQRAGGQEHLAMRLAALTESNQQILAQHPPAEVAAEIRRRLAMSERPAQAVPAVPAVQRPAAWAWTLGGLATGGLALAALLLVAGPAGRKGAVAPGQPSAWPLPGEAPEVNTIKGLRPQLAIYRKVADRADRLSPGSSVRPGDILQLAYVSARRSYGVVASVDARGTVTMHLPEGEGAAAQLAAQGETPLPHGYRLDDSPGFERFVLVTANQPFTTGAVRDLLLHPGKALPAGFTITEHTLSKETQ
jgi:hypothetical protein